MKRRSAIPSRSDCLAPTDPRLLGNPLDFIAEDHLRERQVCALIDGIANAERADIQDLEDILSFLREELALHIVDEEAGLFPLMSAKCAAEDEIENVIARLRSDHAVMGAAVPQVRDCLAGLLSGKAGPDDDDRRMLTQFATTTRRHLIVENAIILPIARARLDAADLDGLRMGMLQRRGLDRLTEVPDAG